MFFTNLLHHVSAFFNIVSQAIFIVHPAAFRGHLGLIARRESTGRQCRSEIRIRD
jgi:hypothetical protein